MHIWIENAHLCPKISFFGGSNSLNGQHYQHQRKRTSFWGNTSYNVEIVKIGPCLAAQLNPPNILWFAMFFSWPDTPKCPFQLGHLHPHITHGSLDPPDSPTQTASQSDEPFLHSLPRRVTFPLKISPFKGGSGPHLIHGSLGEPKLTSQTASRLIEPLLQGSRSRQTDRPRHSVCRNMQHLASVAMQHNNY